MSSATYFFPATFFDVFAEVVLLVLHQRHFTTVPQKRSELKTRNEKHGFVTSLSPVSFYVVLLLISFGVT